MSKDRTVVQARPYESWRSCYKITAVNRSREFDENASFLLQWLGEGKWIFFYAKTLITLP